MSAVWLRSAVERTVATYLEAFLGLLLVAPKLDLGVVEVALVSALPAALAVVKAYVAQFVGERGTASLVDGGK